MSVQQAVENFLTWCAINRSRATGRLYRSRLNSLVSMFGPRILTSLERPEIEGWLHGAGRWPDGSQKAPDTRRANAIAFLQLQKWAIEYKHLSAPMVEKLPKPIGRERDRVPTAEETARLLEHAPPAFGLMYRALRQSGARPNELCRATIADWHRAIPPHGVILLEEHKTAEKTGKPRRIVVGAALEQLLLQAIGERASGPIFRSQSGHAWSPQRLSTIYRQLRNKAGLPRDLCLYLARHEHGTVLTQKLGIHAAKEALGHTSIKTTQRYAHSTDTERAAAQDAFQG
jgi:integrase